MRAIRMYSNENTKCVYKNCDFCINEQKKTPIFQLNIILFQTLFKDSVRQAWSTVAHVITSLLFIFLYLYKLLHFFMSSFHDCVSHGSFFARNGFHYHDEYI